MSKARTLFVAMCLCGALALGGCESSPAVYQVSTLQALMQGAYEGQVACSELPRHGTLGIGTFDGLDGEMILLDGQVYQATADGRVIRNPHTTTPFANVVRFRPQTHFVPLAQLVPQTRPAPQANAPASDLNLEQVLAMLDAAAGSKNLFYAVRIDGYFPQVKVRSIPRQSRPYPPLAQAAANQRVFDLRNVRGTLVGFCFPQYAGGLNMPGWHLHFISDDRTRGGHVLEIRARDLDVRLQTIRRFEMTLPAGGAFVTADLGKDMSKEIHEVEK